jgi:hypothetical protein
MWLLEGIYGAGNFFFHGKGLWRRRRVGGRAAFEG